jgi:hypothetical protein
VTNTEFTWVQKLIASVALVLLTATPVLAQPAEDKEALAKQSQNPIADLISLPLQNNTFFGVGPNNATTNDFNIQPVYPIPWRKLNIINRFVLPVRYQGELVPGAGSKSGLGDLSYTAYFSPVGSGKVTWGVGPSFIFPTATDDQLGAGKWTAGLGAVVAGTTGKWVIGALAQNTWSFAGDEDRADINAFLTQYFINYNIQDGWYLTTSPILTANWEAASGEQWTIPFGGGFGKVIHIGKMPTDIQVQAFTNVEKPEGGADWSFRLKFKMLFPK